MATSELGKKATRLINNLEKIIKAAQEIKQELEELKPPKDTEG